MSVIKDGRTLSILMQNWYVEVFDIFNRSTCCGLLNENNRLKFYIVQHDYRPRLQLIVLYLFGKKSSRIGHFLLSRNTQKCLSILATLLFLYFVCCYVFQFSVTLHTSQGRHFRYQSFIRLRFKIILSALCTPHILGYFYIFQSGVTNKKSSQGKKLQT